ncbi:alpha-2-macroglobulin [Novosphingobium sp. TH158]|uniref:alpha-2-macroglobulin family protein n=1 Tax=Novosphingobium sp. TH158 TaxID=2067455 RepID=UPI000C7D54D2|nr:MG2 domain-containing protein [Novosphingobium sp. TH158]PLK26927.1 alpha-2-macroglobulin [Novosphingobium sp. TH158]
MRARWILSLIAIATLPFAAHSDTAPQVVLATMGTGGGAGGAVERFTLRFSEPMVPLGDPRARPAATSDCPVPATGRWVDQQTFVLDFERPLPGGLSCKVQLRDRLTTLRGLSVGGPGSYPIDTGGPSVRAVLAPGSDGDIDEDQVFLVATNVWADPASVAARASCAVDGIGEAGAVDVLPADTAGKVLDGLGEDNWTRRNFLEEAGLPTRLPADARLRVQALSNVTALKCRRPLPPERDMALVWPKTISGKGGKLAGTDQRFDYTVRKAFAASFDCGRINAAAGCNPITPAWVRFTAPIDRAKALAVRLRMADGTEFSPRIDPDSRGDAQLSDLQFTGPFPAGSVAQVILPADIIDLSGRRLSNAARFPLAVRFDAMPPLVKFAAEFGIVEASEGLLPATVRAVEPDLIGKATAIDGRSARIADDDRVIAQWLRRLKDATRRNYEYIDQKDGSTRAINRTGEKPLLRPAEGAAIRLPLPGKGKDFEVIGVPVKQRGFHVVEFASPALGRALLGRNVPRYVPAAALVTDMAVHFKWGRESSLVWVTSLSGGKPVAGAAVRVSDSCTGAQIATGTTGRDGTLLVRGNLPEPDTGGGCEEDQSHPLMVSARAAGDMSFTLTTWNDGISPYDFDLSFGASANSEIIHTIMDRALVRVGETVNFKHVLRKPIGPGFAFAKGFSGKFVLRHNGSETEFSQPVTIDAMGSGENSWAVPQGAPLGTYSLRFEVEGRTIYSMQDVRVDEYRLPTMRASVTGPDQPLVQPRAVPLSLFVGYLSGGGAGQLPVTLRTEFEATSRSPRGWEAYDFGGAEVKEGVRPMSIEGEGEVTDPLPYSQTLPATLGADGTAKTAVDVSAPINQPVALSVEMDYPDANGETLTAGRRIVLYPSAVQLGMKTDGWMMRSSDLRLNFIALDLSDRPLTGQMVKVELFSKQTITARRRLIGGFYAYDNQQKVERLSAGCTGSTNAQGRADCVIDAGVSGEVTVVATTTDRDGRVARSVRSVWLAGEDDWWFGGDNGDRMDVIPEKTAYAAGETARLQVRMPYREATALVTVEREGVLSSYVTELSGKDPVIEVKMPGSYAPNVYVSVMAVRGRVTGARPWLAEMAQKLGIPYTAGGVLPTATVDLAKPSYRIGMTQLKVGWEAHKLAVEVKAEKEAYAVRETARVKVAVRDPSGKGAPSADLAFVAVDEALLQLMPNDSWKLLDAMMGERSLEVATSTAQMQVVGKRHYGKKAVAAGGGGGDASGVNRENFQPVLLWKGRVALDSRGEAVVEVPLSDALTRFRLVAIATDGAQLFGTGETAIRTRQDLAVYPGLPPLVRTGDRFDAVFTLRNGSDKPMTVTARPRVEGGISADDARTVTIPAGGASRVQWTVAAPAEPGSLKWTVEARSKDGKFRDTVVAMQEVAPAVPVEVWAAGLYRVGEGEPPAIMVPQGALPGGFVDVALSDSLAPPLGGVRDYMLLYPWTCFEQRLSRIVATGDAAAWESLASAMPSYLDGDGLLRYFPSAEMRGSTELTAYVLAITAAADLKIPEATRARMVAALKGVIEGRVSRDRPFAADERLVKIAALSALARAGAAEPGLVARIDMVPAQMPTGTLADWIAALDRLPKAPKAAMLKAAAEGELRKRLVYEGTRLDLSDSARAPWWMMVSADEMAIKVLDATLGKPGWQAEAPRLMVGLASRQQKGHWDTTLANAWGSVVVRRFAALYPATAIAGTTRLALGGKTLEAKWPRAADPQPLRLPLVTGPLAMTQSGGAGPWASVTVRAAVPLKEPLMAGYRLAREVTVVSAREKGRLSAGDVVRVKLSITATADRNWVVLADPLPPGATVMSGLGGQSALARKDEGRASEGAYPAYVENQKDSWRAYFDWLPRGTTTVEYTVRLNGSGQFTLPPARVEAMYAPSIRAQLPVGAMTVWGS